MNITSVAVLQLMYYTSNNTAVHIITSTYTLITCFNICCQTCEVTLHYYQAWNIG